MTLPFRFLRYIVGGTLLLCAGCGPSPKASPGSQEKNKISKMEVPGEITGTDWHIPWRTRDPKNPKAWLPVLIADARQGAMVTEGSGATVRLQQVRVRLFRDGKPAAMITSPRMAANEAERIVVGKGGCVVTSLTNPPDTVLKADTITWNMPKNKIIAVGHASVVRHPQNGGSEITQSGGRITMDTSLKGTIVVE